MASCGAVIKPMLRYELAKPPHDNGAFPVVLCASCGCAWSQKR